MSQPQLESGNDQNNSNETKWALTALLALFLGYGLNFLTLYVGQRAGLFTIMLGKPSVSLQVNCVDRMVKFSSDGIVQIEGADSHLRLKAADGYELAGGPQMQVIQRYDGTSSINIAANGYDLSEVSEIVVYDNSSLEELCSIGFQPR